MLAQPSPISPTRLSRYPPRYSSDLVASDALPSDLPHLQTFPTFGPPPPFKTSPSGTHCQKSKPTIPTFIVKASPHEDHHNHIPPPSISRTTIPIHHHLHGRSFTDLHADPHPWWSLLARPSFFGTRPDTITQAFLLSFSDLNQTQTHTQTSPISFSNLVLCYVFVVTCGLSIICGHFINLYLF